MKMFSKMLEIAAVEHSGQFDKIGVPYVLHVISVADLVPDDEELKCIACGHDLFEDTKITAEQLRKIGFSERVIDGIDRLTKKPGMSLDDYKRRIFDSIDAMIVKYADLTHNTDPTRRSPDSEKTRIRQEKYKLFKEEIVQEMLRHRGQYNDDHVKKFLKHFKSLFHNYDATITAADHFMGYPECGEDVRMTVDLFNKYSIYSSEEIDLGKLFDAK